MSHEKYCPLCENIRNELSLKTTECVQRKNLYVTTEKFLFLDCSLWKHLPLCTMTLCIEISTNQICAGFSMKKNLNTLMQNNNLPLMAQCLSVMKNELCFDL